MEFSKSTLQVSNTFTLEYVGDSDVISDILIGKERTSLVGTFDKYFHGKYLSISVFSYKHGRNMKKEVRVMTKHQLYTGVLLTRWEDGSLLGGLEDIEFVQSVGKESGKLKVTTLNLREIAGNINTCGVLSSMIKISAIDIVSKEELAELLTYFSEV